MLLFSMAFKPAIDLDIIFVSTASWTLRIEKRKQDAYGLLEEYNRI